MGTERTWSPHYFIMTLGNTLKVPCSSMLSKESPKKAAITKGKFDVTSKFQYTCADIRLQASDKQRKYPRRGSKTPKMLLISAGLDFTLFEKELFPNVDGGDVASSSSSNEHVCTSNAVASATQKALAMAAAVDFFSETKVEELRMKRRGIRSTKEKVPEMPDIPLLTLNEANAETDKPKMSLKTELFHPRSLSAMSALRKSFEKASISTASVGLSSELLDERGCTTKPSSR